MSKRYMQAYGSLYGDKVVGIKRQAPRKKPVQHEEHEQLVLAAWLTKMGVPFFHIPNGGSRNMLEAVKFKRMGVQRGIPDICVPLARKGRYALWIELKRASGGRVSDEQRYWIDLLNKEGHLALVCHGAIEAIKAVESYLLP